MAKLTVAQFTDLINALDGIDADVHIHVAVNCDVGDADAVRTVVGDVATDAPTPVPTPAATPAKTASDFPVGAAISWAGRLFNGGGTVIKHNPNGSISVRITDCNSRSRKRVNLNVDDLNSGNLTLMTA